MKRITYAVVECPECDRIKAVTPMDLFSDPDAVRCKGCSSPGNPVRMRLASDGFYDTLDEAYDVAEEPGIARGLCPVCGCSITLTGEVLEGNRLVGSCGDTFTERAWEKGEAL